MRLVVQDDNVTKATYSQLGNKKRKPHLNEDGQWDENVNFLRGISKDGKHWGANAPYLHKEMGESAIAEVLENWNDRLDLRPGSRLTSGMGRKTHCTLGDKCAAKFLDLEMPTADDSGGAMIIINPIWKCRLRSDLCFVFRRTSDTTARCSGMSPTTGPRASSSSTVPTSNALL